MSFLIAGGSIQTGQVIGSTTSKGEYSKDHKLDPNDLLSTVYCFLDIDYKKKYVNNAGLPVPLTRGTPIPGLL